MEFKIGPSNDPCEETIEKAMATSPGMPTDVPRVDLGKHEIRPTSELEEDLTVTPKEGTNAVNHNAGLEDEKYLEQVYKPKLFKSAAVTDIGNSFFECELQGIDNDDKDEDPTRCQ